MKRRRLDRIRRRFGMNERNRYILVFVCCILIPACVLIYFYYVKSSDIIEQEVTQSILQTLKQSKINISNRLAEVENMSESVFMNAETMEFVGNENDGNILLQTQQTKDLRTLFSNVTANNSQVKIRMFIAPEKLAASEHVCFFSVDDIRNYSWYPEIVERKGAVYWTGVYSQTYADGTARNVISCGRVLKHTYDYNDNSGILLLDIDETSLYSLISSIQISHASVFIIDSAGKAVSIGDKSLLGKVVVSGDELREIDSGQAGVASLTKDDQRTCVVYQEIDPAGWRLVAEVGRNEIVRSNTVFTNISAFVFIIVMFIAVVFGIFLIVLQTMDNLHRQVVNLAVHIEKEGVDILDEESRDPCASGDIMRLETYVYGMIRKVKTLMDETYRSRIREREAQIKALQAQINPHFLYNTLDTINWMAVKIDADDISFMINSLARYFRLSLNKGKEVVCIRDELELARAYLSIQQTMFKGAVQFRFETDQKAEDCLIQKLTLQPIVENAVLHGIQKNRNRAGWVIIETKQISEREIVISVRDDGPGMDRDTLNRVLKFASAEGESHYGLFNVNERLRLFFGEEYGIRLFSSQGEGTRVEVHIGVRKSRL